MKASRNAHYGENISNTGLFEDPNLLLCYMNIMKVCYFYIHHMSIYKDNMLHVYLKHETVLHNNNYEVNILFLMDILYIYIYCIISQSDKREKLIQLLGLKIKIHIKLCLSN